MRVRQRSMDRPGKWLGIVVFAVGVGLLLVVFVFAYRELIAAPGGSAVSSLLAEPAALAFKGALLFVMGLVASAIANKGIALYRAAQGFEIDELT